MNNKKCPHGFYLGPNGEHIIPSNVAVSMSDAAKRHEPPVIMHRPKQQTKLDIELEQSAKEIKEKYGKHGVIPDSVFDFDRFRPRRTVY